MGSTLTLTERIDARSLYQNHVSMQTLTVLYGTCEYQMRRVLGMDYTPSLQKCLYCRECWNHGG